MFHHLSPFFFFWILRDLRVILQICHLQDFGKLTEPLLRRPPQRLGFLHRVIFKALRRGRGQVLEGNLRWAGQCWSCHLNFKL